MCVRALALTCSVAAAALATPALAETGAWGAGVEIMDDAEMAGLRGGIAITPSLEINFGARITTYVDGAPALTTNLTWSDMGQFVQETVGNVGQRIDQLTPEQRTELGVDGLEAPGGVVISDAAGVTALVHNITEGALQNIIVNTATGRDLRQEIDITLTLPGFEAVQDSLLLEGLGIQIDEDMRGVMFGVR